MCINIVDMNMIYGRGMCSANRLDVDMNCMQGGRGGGVGGGLEKKVTAKGRLITQTVGGVLGSVIGRGINKNEGSGYNLWCVIQGDAGNMENQPICMKKKSVISRQRFFTLTYFPFIQDKYFPSKYNKFL